MADYLEMLQGYAVDAIEAKGVKVFLKTDIGPEIQVYDSDAPASNGEGLPIKYAVRVTDRNGKAITQYGEPPATDTIKASIIWGGMGFAMYIMLSGVARIINK